MAESSLQGGEARGGAGAQSNRGRFRWAVDMSQWGPSAAEFDALLQILPEARRGEVTSFVRPADRQRALLSRLLQTSAVAQALHLPWHAASAAIFRTPLGRPCMSPGVIEGSSAHLPCFDFNASHHGDLVVLAAEPWCLVGVDVMAHQQPHQQHHHQQQQQQHQHQHQLEHKQQQEPQQQQHHHHPHHSSSWGTRRDPFFTAFRPHLSSAEWEFLFQPQSRQELRLQEEQRGRAEATADATVEATVEATGAEATVEWDSAPQPHLGQALQQQRQQQRGEATSRAASAASAAAEGQQEKAEQFRSQLPLLRPLPASYQRFYKFWCLKESYIKAVGTGFLGTHDLASLSFSLPEAPSQSPPPPPTLQPVSWATQPGSPLPLDFPPTLPQPVCVAATKGGHALQSWRFHLHTLPRRGGDHWVAVARAPREEGAWLEGAARLSQKERACIEEAEPSFVFHNVKQFAAMCIDMAGS